MQSVTTKYTKIHSIFIAHSKSPLLPITKIIISRVFKTNMLRNDHLEIFAFTRSSNSNSSPVNLLLLYFANIIKQPITTSKIHFNNELSINKITIILQRTGISLNILFITLPPRKAILQLQYPVQLQSTSPR